MIVDRLSKIEKLTEKEKGTEIEENFLDKQLFQVIVQVPWYVDIMNYLVCGVMPPKLIYEEEVEDRC